MYGKKKKMTYGGMSRKPYREGGKAKADIYALEDSCNSMSGYNQSLPQKR